MTDEDEERRSMVLKIKRIEANEHGMPYVGKPEQSSWGFMTIDAETAAKAMAHYYGLTWHNFHIIHLASGIAITQTAAWQHGETLDKPILDAIRQHYDQALSAPAPTEWGVQTGAETSWRSKHLLQLAGFDCQHAENLAKSTLYHDHEHKGQRRDITVRYETTAPVRATYEETLKNLKCSVHITSKHSSIDEQKITCYPWRLPLAVVEALRGQPVRQLIDDPLYDGLIITWALPALEHSKQMQVGWTTA